MKKASPTKQTNHIKPVNGSLKTTYSILLLAYLLVPVFTPNFFTLDSAGPKFVTLALLNLISFFVLLYDSDFRHRPELKSGFFLNFIGLAYTTFLFVNLLSFFQAYNFSESILNFAKFSTVFASTYILYVIFSSNKAYLQLVALAFSFLLLLDSLTVFYHILEYVNKNVDSIYDIKSVYSHKNILSAALFIKIPAALWLMFFSENWKKKIGYLSFLAGALAILFMSARAFYFGLALLVVALAIFFIIRRIGTKQNFSLKKAALFAGLFVVALVAFSLIQRYLYPVNQDSKEKFNTGVLERMSTIKADESSTNARLTTWKRSFRLIQEHPVLGVGTGNWKVEVLKYEAPMADNHIISYKNHNDFIEVTAEMGLIGGLIYLSLFVSIFFIFIKTTVQRPANEEMVKYLFLPAFGILAYSVDAFFNFPNDRPEIQVLFAMYIAMAVAFSGSSFSVPEKWIPKTLLLSANSKGISTYIFRTILFITLGIFAIILYKNAVSLHFQSLVSKEIKANEYSHTSSFYKNGFPAIPDLSCEGDPISTFIARYLIHENRADEAVNLLLNDNPSPYDGRREYYLCLAYEKLGNSDSAIYWGLRSCVLKPRFANMVTVTSSKLFAVGRQKEAVQTMDNYLALVKTNPSAWLLAADQNLKMGNKQKAIVLMDSANKYLPDNEKIKNNWAYLHQTNTTLSSDDIYTKAKQAMDAKLYHKALQLLNEFISKQNNNTEAYQKRALCLYFLQNFQKSLADIDTAIKRGDGNAGFLLNLKGVNYINLDKPGEACIYFKKAMELGDVDGVANYKKFCTNK